MASSPARRRGTFGAFRQPFLTDPVFWIAALLALAIGALVGGALVALGGVPDSAVMWVVTLVLVLIAAWLGFKLLAMGLNMGRALESEDVADEGRAQKLEDKGRTAGAVLGKGAAKLVKGRSGATPTAGSTPSASQPPPCATAPPDPQPAEPVRPAASQPAPSPSTGAPPPASAEPSPDVTVDKAARVIGSMVGRRIADRRKDGG